MNQAVNLAMRPPMHVCVHACMRALLYPATLPHYLHRSFLLKTLPLCSTGSPGSQDIQEDAHLGRGRDGHEQDPRICTAPTPPNEVSLPLQSSPS